jgi:RNA polymerase sigma-70 factor (ECF subfamily)
LYAIEGFTHLEISKNVGISVGTSKWHLSNARKILKKLIDQNNLRQYAG